ncbi:ThuA domain-containing protein [Planctomyces sp. SH-PL62]|uniref:ThuA domain-containing protein n=1 Tax=Planctomyces sp. SH-PL62 TaxID=1636152 RepID=UPI00078B3D27|nr:ThuA domain-containing protein [Planctomyces sp. SH-PL62]AMV36466.1 Trehalose utilization [Planctomyces sp. SH-PL62]
MARAFSRWFGPACLLLLPLAARAADEPAKAEAPHVVLISGDEEYRSEESLPMLARILDETHGFRVSVCYALNEQGKVDPNVLTNIAGLEALDDADLVVMYTRFRKLPDHQLDRIRKYAESGRPIMGFRTATHAFRYDGGPHAAEMNEAWERKVFGQKWITHHGHFGDGLEMLTAVSPEPSAVGHPTLRGVTPFETYSWLYHVEGGGDALEGDCTRLLIGKALKSGHAKEFDRFPETNPVAWTKTYTGASGKPARVFFTTLGHPFDFKAESMRKLALNGVFWALGLEEKIPADGVKADFVGPYEPNNSGVGGFKKDLKPAYLAGPKP